MRLSNILSLLLIFSLLSCQTLVPGDANEDIDIESIKILYAPEGVDLNVPATCESVEYAFVEGMLKEKVFTEPSFIEAFSDYMQDLKRGSERYTPDVRIKCFIKRSSATDTLCLGESFGAIYNGIPMSKYTTLLDYIKSHIYDTPVETDTSSSKPPFVN